MCRCQDGHGPHVSTENIYHRMKMSPGVNWVLARPLTNAPLWRKQTPAPSIGALWTCNRSKTWSPKSRDSVSRGSCRTGDLVTHMDQVFWTKRQAFPLATRAPQKAPGVAPMHHVELAPSNIGARGGVQVQASHGPAVDNGGRSQQRAPQGPMGRTARAGAPSHGH